MSTYWSFECEAHDPPLQSEEFTQHTDDQYYEYGITLALARPLVELEATFRDGTKEYFDRNARGFLMQHPKCKLGLINEYGVRRELPRKDPAV